MMSDAIDDVIDDDEAEDETDELTSQVSSIKLFILGSKIDLCSQTFLALFVCSFCAFSAAYIT